MPLVQETNGHWACDVLCVCLANIRLTLNCLTGLDTGLGWRSANRFWHNHVPGFEYPITTAICRHFAAILHDQASCYTLKVKDYVILVLLRMTAMLLMAILLQQNNSSQLTTDLLFFSSCISFSVVFPVEGNCTKASHGEGLFHRNFPNCQKCHCSKGEQQLCRPVKCAPSSATLPENCIKQRCIEFPWPEQCCPTYGFCECTKWQVPLSVNPQCSEPPSCPSNRTSGKNISSVRYYYDQQEERCVMFWQTPKCSDDRSYSSLSACRTQCVPTDHPGE